MQNLISEIVNERSHTDLLAEDFYFELPEDQIAQHPSKERDKCRLMVLPKVQGKVDHRIFSDIVDYLRPEDMLVVNSSKVIPARLEQPWKA